MTLTIDSETADIRVARHFVEEAGPFLGMSFDAATVGLLVSEVVGNAVALEVGPVLVSLRRLGARILRVEVRDDGWGQPAISPRNGDRAGRGLVIVDRLADAWGVSQFVPGKIVWFEVAALPRQSSA